MYQIGCLSSYNLVFIVLLTRIIIPTDQPGAYFGTQFCTRGRGILGEPLLLMLVVFPWWN